MEKRIVRRWWLASLALTACGGEGVVAPEVAPNASEHPGHVVARANGSGHFQQGGELRSFTFAAVGRADGSASGEFHVTIHAIDRRFHATVTCMSVRNDTAWVAGIIDRTDHPVIVPGTVSYFWAVDGGEGAGGGDVVSIARINDAAGEDQRFCGLMPDEDFSGLPGVAVEQGEVQVAGG